MMTLENIRELVLAVALFFNPFGYNELFAYTMNHTGSYWKTSFIFYVFSGSLFAIYFYLKLIENKRRKRVLAKIFENEDTTLNRNRFANWRK